MDRKKFHSLVKEALSSNVARQRIFRAKIDDKELHTALAILEGKSPMPSEMQERYIEYLESFVSGNK